MTAPISVELDCPLCGEHFQAREMGDSYSISGIDTDLRETGSVESVRRYSVASCPSCGYADFTWDFLEAPDLTESARTRLSRDLGRRGKVKKAAESAPAELRDFLATRRCFDLRGVDAAARAELALLTYYVARDLEVEPVDALREDAAECLAAALDEEEGPSPLSVRYAYLAGELRRLGSRGEDALAFFDRAVSDAEALEDDGIPLDNEVNIPGLARRRRAEIVHSNDSSEDLVAVCRVKDRDVRAEVARILATRRDAASLRLIPKVYGELSEGERVAMLREMAAAPHPALLDTMLDGLRSRSAEAVRCAARGLAELGDMSAVEPLHEALERGLLTTEADLVDALAKLDPPELAARLDSLLERWEQETSERWAERKDVEPLRSWLYRCSDSRGLDRLKADMMSLEDNDLWDKPPFGSPIPALIARGAEVTPLLEELLAAPRPETRRWAAHVACELECRDLKPSLRRLLDDDDLAVRLQAAKTLARLGEKGLAGRALEMFDAVPDEELPFALHFLVEFRSPQLRKRLLDWLDRGLVTAGEVLPLLGRQSPTKAVEALVERSLESDDEDARAGAVTAAAFLGREGTIERLLGMLDEESSEVVQRRLLFGLARLAGTGPKARRAAVLDRLHAAVEDTESRLRYPAALALLQVGDRSGEDLVRERISALDQNLDHYDFVAPALKALASSDS